jgi:hypothetical protein
MLTRLLGFVDAVVRGGIYVSLLVVGLSFSAAGAYVAVMLAYRCAQFLARTLLANPW